MKKEKLVTVGIIALVLILAGIIISFKTGLIGQAVKGMPSEEVAKWIGGHSVLYVQTGCIHCIEQEKLFGDNVKYLTVIDCLKEGNTQACINAGIEGTPTWIINGQKYVGVQEIETLKELTGYQE